jgi:2-polyprenyl-6-methoxyphenol hydroxylase-like FAD-dependent oxidoreductase
VFAHKKPEVLVVGAGPVGLFTALVLAHRGVRVQIIDKEPCPGTRSYALALHAETLRLFEEMGILNDIIAGALRVRRVGLYDAAKRRAEMRISDLAQDHSFLAVLAQDELETRLVTALAKRGVRVEWSHELSQLAQSEDHAAVQVDRLSLDQLGYSVQHSEWVVTKGKQFQVPFVVGADGLASVVRRRAAIDFPTVGASSDFAVFEFQTDADLGDELRLVLGDHTTNACWPLPNGHCRWSFETSPDDELDERQKDHDLVQIDALRDPTLSEARLRALLAERAPWFKGSIGPIRWRMAVRFERRLVDSFGRGRVWLVGDAGHVTGPVGIHSMNVGFREGAQLANGLCAALRGTTAADRLEEYDASRRAEWRGLLGVSEVLLTRSSTDPWLAARKNRLATCIPASGRDLGRIAEQLGFACTLSAPSPGAVTPAATGNSARA